MNTHATIGNALFTKTQQRVLGLLYGKPEQSYYLNEIARLAKVGKGSVSRELEKLSASGLLTKNQQGNQIHYQANIKNPIYTELVNIIKKTFGVTDSIRVALLPVFEKIQQAFIYGSLAKGTEHANSDIDLMLIADELSYAELMALLTPLEVELGRSINPTLLSPQELSERIVAKQSFITRVMAQPKLWIKGGAHGSTG